MPIVEAEVPAGHCEGFNVRAPLLSNILCWANVWNEATPSTKCLVPPDCDTCGPDLVNKRRAKLFAQADRDR